ncbi:MAG: nickel-dependent hydrogenase large subunit [Cocleimonas sp.]|nr:nickel-dependent hydrogenase large subunit [Cocleimonas sp.]
MSIAGELNITLNASDNHKTRCQISSSRPLQASHVFTGKTINETLTMIPLLFNICSKAQAITAVRAIESAKQTPATPQSESTREALIALESLREQALRITMDWPTFIGNAPESPLLSHIALGITQIMKLLEPSQVLGYQAPTSKAHSITKEQSLQWKTFSKTLSKGIFGSSSDNSPATWLVSDLDEWASQQKTQAAAFIHWLNQQTWKNAGESNITHLPTIDDNALLKVLLAEQHQFTSQPDWKKQCHELSWFSRKQQDEASNKSVKSNGIFSRMVARLVEVADLMTALDEFFIHDKTLAAPKSSAIGLAHSHAARGRLSHYINVENSTVKKLLILAPTEWNFHPQGVTQNSLCNLQADNETDLRQQAELLIHAIDPCVGYTLKVATK